MAALAVTEIPESCAALAARCSGRTPIFGTIPFSRALCSSRSVRPEEARAIGWEEDVDLDGTPPSVAVLRADRAGGDTKTPRSRRALKLAQVAVGALREWQVGQAAERAAAGSQWQDTGRVFTTATGTPLGARHIRKMFQDVCERAGLGRDWAPRDLRHTFVLLLSDDGMAVDKIARLAGHASSHVTETWDVVPAAAGVSTVH